MITEQVEQRIFSISELTKRIKGELEGNFRNVWVEGEISNLAMPRSGHIYCTLKDEQSQLRAVVFKFASKRLTFALEDGMQILARGSLSVYEPRGEYQIVIEYAEPRGAGALQVAFEQLKRRLADEGLFDAARKKPIPLLPKKIGVVTSPTGAAIRDILNIIGRRFANVHILIAPVRVQGAEAPAEIGRAIGLFNQLQDVDVLIVGRGGGSLEDLWAFNDEGVARAIFASRIPVISAVGHEVDFTIADFVADLRAPTPSAAAELVVQNKDNLQYTLDTLLNRLQQAFRNQLDQRHFALEQCTRRLHDPRKRLHDLQQRTDDLQRSLIASMQHLLITKRLQFEKAAGKLESLSPLGLLARGYAVCHNAATARIIKTITDAAPGDAVLVRISDGELACDVTEVRPQ